ncbi:uncharacterized protein [Nicotiana sylvestris]|uniref:Uncharacterized protein LOC104242390 n=1 Tax=Nicotiana sylvestris TaxID=4096 RepID=A0A1U7YA67_NICSY|nr:PREDICTED: uncharacterized protein LOC104242390 [Nicotiana sylvestris]
MTIEGDSICYVQKFRQCQIHGDFIWVPPNELNIMGSPWSFASWGMDVIGPRACRIEWTPFILVEIDNFTIWVDVFTYKALTKQIVAYFVCNNIVCPFGIPESIITDNATNLNSDRIREIFQKFKIVHRNSTTYRLKKNEPVEAANKNIKGILL